MPESTSRLLKINHIFHVLSSSSRICVLVETFYTLVYTWDHLHLATSSSIVLYCQVHDYSVSHLSFSTTDHDADKKYLTKRCCDILIKRKLPPHLRVSFSLFCWVHNEHPHLFSCQEIQEEKKFPDCIVRGSEYRHSRDDSRDAAAVVFSASLKSIRVNSTDQTLEEFHQPSSSNLSTNHQPQVYTRSVHDTQRVLGVICVFFN